VAAVAGANDHDGGPDRDLDRIGELAPFNGGTYVFVTVPATTSGGSAMHSIVAVDNNGNTLWTVTP
jgi:hypothetical protein